MTKLPGDLSSANVHAVLEALASGVSIANTDGRILYSNEAADRMLGIMRTDRPPSEWADHYGVFVPGTDTPFPEADYPLVRALAGEEPDDVEMLIRNPELADEVTIECSARPLRGDGGSINGAVVIFRDVSALARARADLVCTNQELRETQRLKEELNGFVVHDLKSPITTVMALAELLETADDLDAEQVRADAAEIRGAAERMHRMALDLLDLQLAEDGRLEIERETVPAGELIHEVARAVRARAPGIEVAPVTDELAVACDHSLLFRVLSNLVDNCVKYGPDGGRILLEAEAGPGGDVRLSVQDEGPGVPEELREQIFEKYTRLERGSGRRVADSRGLGLRFCRMVAEAHGGMVRVEDAEPVGARFVLSLPVG